jgi:hypothetical protein
MTINVEAIISALVILLVFVPLLGAAIVAALALAGWLLLRDHSEALPDDASS